MGEHKNTLLVSHHNLDDNIHTIKDGELVILNEASHAYMVSWQGITFRVEMEKELYSLNDQFQQVPFYKL